MFRDLTTAIATFTALATALLGILKYFQYKTRRDKIMAVRQSFETVVKALASTDDVDRYAGAILLRRFFDHKSEVGIAGTPYWKAAVDVSAAILRGQERGNFQKLLADGLAFAPSLERADLQRTNLQFAHLGARAIPRSEWYRRMRELSPNRKKHYVKTIITNLSYADFYRSDLSHASLKRAKAKGAIFYQARMHNTVLKGADLREANFFEADLSGANFDGALLYQASFAGVQNIPDGIKAKLDKEDLYGDKNPFVAPESRATTKPLRVFISKPGILDKQQQQQLTMLKTKLESEGMVPETLERVDYPSFSTVREIQRVMHDCVGVVVVAFKQIEIRDGSWRVGTPEEKHLKGQCFSSPWNQIEAGMAAMLNIPILVLCQRGIDDGIFDPFDKVDLLHRAFIDEDWEAIPFSNRFLAWCADVKQQNRTNT